MSKLTIIGDVHGKVEDYLVTIKQKEYTVQIGDMGFKDSYNKIKKYTGNEGMLNVDMTNHRFIPGNHDDYDNLPWYAWISYGKRKFGGYEFFFARGAYSIDHHHRIPNISWWPNEELSHIQCNSCIEEYANTKPEIMLTHDCPWRAYPKVMSHHFHSEQKPSVTAELLDRLFEIHQPKLWIHGHHHKTLTYNIGHTKFMCLNELQWVDLNEVL